jgi:hypothetical protein
MQAYAAAHWRSAFPAGLDDVVGQRSSMQQYLGAIAFCVLAGLLGLWRGRSQNWGWNIWLALASLFFFVFAWNAEAQERARHTVDVWVYVTIAVILSLGTLADEAIRLLKSRRSVTAGEVAVSEPTVPAGGDSNADPPI